MNNDTTEAPATMKAELDEALDIVETAEGWALQIEGPGEPKEGERKANRKERRDYIRSLPRMIRLGYGFGQWRRVRPGKFVTPARPR